MRGLILAIQFLTRLPTPQLNQFNPAELTRCAVWFPLVGLVIGDALYCALWLGNHIDPWFAALLALLVWVWITGALHLDGLADMSDALGAAHRDRERFLTVLADPHLGTFGVVTLIMQLLCKLVLLMLIARSQQYMLICLIPAWARWGTLIWAKLPSLKPGMGERFSWQISNQSILLWALVLFALSQSNPWLCLIPVAVWGWRVYLLKRLGGMTGDLLGAGTEIVETVGLLALVLVVVV